jgi:hypothetical protein
MPERGEYLGDVQSAGLISFGSDRLLLRVQVGAYALGTLRRRELERRRPLVCRPEESDAKGR